MHTVPHTYYLAVGIVSFTNQSKPKKPAREGTETLCPQELQESDAIRTTREMIERAVSLAFTDTTGLDQATFEDPRESMDSTASGGFGASQGKENLQRQSGNPESPSMLKPTHKMGALQKRADLTIAASKNLRRNQNERRESRAKQLRDAVNYTKAQQELQRKLNAAAFEHQQRKLAVQALQKHIQREIQYLEATAADLEKRESLLDDAFANYEEMLQLEYGVNGVDGGRGDGYSID